MSLYVLKPEHAARFAEYRDRWIDIAMRTRPMDDVDRQKCRDAAIAMYAAGKPPPRIVFVQSPLMAAAVFGASAWICHARKHGGAATYAATDAATDAATWAATHDATYAATYAATRAATDAATDAATYDATSAATSAATAAATSAATRAATCDATYAATYDATADAQDLAKWFVSNGGHFAAVQHVAGAGGLKCAALAYRCRQSGNQWAGWPAMAEWFREVAQLPIDWSKWMPWRDLAEHGGPRYVHEEFVVISDFPVLLKVDNENRPHSATGPFCRWSDGFALYAWHGIRVPAWIIEHPEQITVAKIDAEANAEIRRVMLDRYGMGRYLAETGAEVVHQDVDEGGEPMRLLRRPTTDDDGQPMQALHLRNSTTDPDGTVREYVLRVPPTCRTVWEARNWTFGLEPDARFDGGVA